DLADDLAEAAFGVGQRDGGVGMVEADQRLPGLHRLVLVGAQRRDGAADLRVHVHEVGADVGVVGGLVILADAVVVQTVGDADAGENAGGDQQAGAAGAVGGGKVHLGLRRRHCCTVAMGVAAAAGAAAGAAR